MEIKKLNDKIKLNDQNVKAERDQYACYHDCVEHRYTGSTAAKGCRRENIVSPKTTTLF